MDTGTAPSVLIVYFTLTKQVGRVAEAMGQEFERRGCTVAQAPIEFTDERWAPTLAEFPMKRPFLNLSSILPAQLRHKTGDIRIPPSARAGDYDLVVIASPTWWFQTSMPIRSYLTSPEARTVLHGTKFACVSVSRRYFSINLRQQRHLGERAGGQHIDATHFVVAGNQVTSMLAWLGYMKHGAAQNRVLGLRMPPPNLKPDFDAQARAFAHAVAATAFAAATAATG